MAAKDNKEGKVVYTKTQIEAVDSFNKKVKLLATDLKTSFPANVDVALAHKRITLAVSEFPYYAISAVGAYLYTYREQIGGGDEEFFLKKTFEKELNEGVDPQKIDMVKTLMPLLKQKFVSLGKTDREKYMKTVNEMLDYYLVFMTGES